jgi:YD repeat-containing protein
MTKPRWSIVVAFCLLLIVSAAAAFQTNGPVQYVYDELGRLIAVIDANGNAAVYNYDAVGNILSIGRYTSSQVAIFGLTPTQGPVGTTVTISGTGFSATVSNNTVSFNGVTANVVSATPNQLVATVPPGATTGLISVTSPNGSATSSTSFVVTTGSGAPTITGISPSVAVAGSAVTINGTNFDLTPQNNRVRFNNVRWATVTSSTAGTIGTTVPTLTGSGRFTVYTPGGVAVSQSDLFIPWAPYTATNVGYTGRMTVGTTQTVSLAATKVGILVFDGIAGQRVSLRLNNSTLASPTMTLRLPDNSTLATAIADGSIASMGLPVTGTYSIGIVEGGSAGSADVQLLSDVTGTIAIDGPPVTVTTVSGQDARLAFSSPVAAGQVFVLTVTNVTNPGASILLLQPTGEPQSTPGLAINSNPSGQIFFLDQQTALTPGMYTLLIQHSSTSSGSETLQLSSAQDFVLPVTPGGGQVRVPTTGDTVVGQNGRLTFTGAVGQKISVNISGGTYGPNPNSCLLGLKDPTGVFLPDSTNTKNCGQGAATFLDAVTLNSAGPYTVFVDPQGRSTGHTTIQVNDASDVTGTISIDGSPVTITTTAPGQDARYTFTATAGQKVFLRVTGVTNPTAIVHLMKPDGNQQTSLIVNNNTPGQVFFVDTQTLAAAGTYTIWIQHSGTSVGSETLQLTSAPDVNLSTTIDGPAVRVPASGNIAVGQDAYLSFAVTAGQRIVVYVTNATIPSATLLLLKPDGSMQSNMPISGTPSGQSYFWDTQTLDTTGTYQLFVRHSSTYTGTVTLQVAGVPPDFTSPITIGGAAVRVPAAGNTAVGQGGVLTFTVAAGQKVSTNVTNATYSPTSACLLTFKNSNGSTVLSSYCGSGMQYIDTLTLAAGTYTILIDPQTTATGTVTLQLNDDTDVTGSISVDGSPVTATTALGQDARYTFNGTTGQRVFLQVSGVTNHAAIVYLLKPNGSSLASIVVNNNTPGQVFLIDTQTLPTDGTYTLLVQHSGQYFGSETLQLNSVPADFTGSLTVNGGAIQVPDTGNTAVGQNASVTFTAAAGQSLKINISSSTYTPASACQLTLKNPSGGVVFNGFNCGNGAGTPISVTAGAAGTYTLLVDPQGANTGSVSISVTSP